MIKKAVRGFCPTLFQFIRQMIGKRKVQLCENSHIYRLGKICEQCSKPVVHRDSISICQCYCFTHKDCIINQLNRETISQCTVIKCKQCNENIHAQIDFNYPFEPRATVSDFIVLSVFLIICCLSMVYLINLKSNQNQEDFTQNNLKGRQNNSQIGGMSFQQICTLAILFIFGTLFWVQIMAMLFKRQTKIRDIFSTNIDIKVSAFLEIETKIKEESQQVIGLKKQTYQI